MYLILNFVTFIMAIILLSYVCKYDSYTQERVNTEYLTTR